MEQPEQFLQLRQVRSVEEQLDQPEQSNMESNMKVSLDPVIDQQSIRIITKELLYSDEEEGEEEE